MLPVASLLRITGDTALFLVIFVPGWLIAAVGATLTDRWVRRAYGLHVTPEGITVGRVLHLPWRDVTRTAVRDGCLVVFTNPQASPPQADGPRGRQAPDGRVEVELWRYEGRAYGLEEALREFAPDGAAPGG